MFACQVSERCGRRVMGVKGCEDWARARSNAADEWLVLELEQTSSVNRLLSNAIQECALRQLVNNNIIII